MSDSLLRTPLYDKHIEAGGRIVPFAGYEMPVQYTGIIAEARAVRESMGMFDVSHMARLDIFGEGSLDFLERVTTNLVGNLKPGQGHYSLIPNESGGTVDDIILYRLGPERFRMVVNASNHAKDVAWLLDRKPNGVSFKDDTEATVMIAVQGPAAASILASLCDSPEALIASPLFGVLEVRIAGIPCFSPRSGYTGEDGFELICSADDGPRLWDALQSAGIIPCGLGSRDTLRVEAGLPLYGHELSEELSPIAAGLGWVISKTKTFVGSEPISEARAAGTPQKLVGIKLGAKRLIEPGAEVTVQGEPVGQVASAVVSPMLNTTIATAFVDRSVTFGTECQVEIRGKTELGTIGSKRFYSRGG